MDETEIQIREMIVAVAGISPDAPADADLYLDLGVASVHALRLLSDLEERFQVQVPDDDFVEATSIAKLSAMMRQLAAAGGGASVA